MRVALLVSTLLSVVCFVIQHFVFGVAFMAAITISVAMIFCVLFAKILGGLLPLGVKAVHLDPALVASPMITTIADTCSLLILFVLAMAILV